MIAYNKTWLYHLFIRSEIEVACNEGCIPKEEKENVFLKFPVAFYTPNNMIRLGLFILTTIILIFSLGLIALLFWNVVDEAAGGLVISFAVIVFVALEYIIQKKHHYKSGVDDALLWGAAISLFCGIILPYNLDGLAISLLSLMITLLCAARYADRLMAVLCFLSFLVVIFFIVIKLGEAAKAVLPFIMIAISLTSYFLVNKKNDTETFNVYRECLLAVQIISLFTLYAAGNYWIVREMSDSLFNLHLQPGESIPFGFVFWSLTVFIPIIYLYFGIKKKDAILLRLGLILVAAIVFTIRYYHAILSFELVMLAWGAAMIVISWALTRYLQSPKHGFTQEELNSRNLRSNMHLESLILAETFSQQPQVAEGTQFGGGNFGGAGASGDF
ncbi:MAG: hypothetical protein ABIN36_01490 [Ferruginibacter sp.]